MEAFSKKLASSDGSVRDKAFKSLRKWLTEQHIGLDEKDYLRLWKALFYCMWMADKPSYQERLAGRLADIGRDLYSTDVTAGFQYMEAFWETLCREWPGLDRYRLDKFYLLLGAGYRATASLRKLGAPLEKVEEMLLRWPLNPTSSSVPDSVRIYSLEHFEEALKATECESEESTTLVIKLLIPVTANIKKSSVLKAAATLFGQMAANNSIQLDWDQVGKAALEAGGEATVASPNRAILYKIRTYGKQHGKR